MLLLDCIPAKELESYYRSVDEDTKEYLLSITPETMPHIKKILTDALFNSSVLKCVDNMMGIRDIVRLVCNEVNLIPGTFL